MCGFELYVTPGAETYVLDARGELDLSTCPKLTRALAAAEQSHAGQILLDLRELTFIDAAGLETLASASRRSASNGGRLRIAKCNGMVAHVLHLTALDLTLPLIDTPDPAESADLESVIDVD